MKKEIYNDCWKFFDKFYCISIDDRTDRRREAKIQFSKVGLLSRVEFVIVKRHLDNCEKGIYESHMTCIKKGIQADAEKMVIFEDDILFQRFDPDNLKQCTDFLSSKSEWSVLFFGCLVAGSKKTQNKCILKIKYRSLAHAYILNRRFAETLAEKPWQGIAFDDMLCSLKENCYTIYPSFAFQSNSPTDNDMFLRLDKFRRLCGGLLHIQKWNELYYRRRAAIISLHILVIVMILLWVF